MEKISGDHRSTRKGDPGFERESNGGSGCYREGQRDRQMHKGYGGSAFRSQHRTKFEAVELRDGETRYFGLGVQHAVKKYRREKLPVFYWEKMPWNRSVSTESLRKRMARTTRAAGANAMLAVSMAVARAAAEALGTSVVPLLWRNLSETSAGTHDEYLKRRKACGEHRGFQEFMIMPVQAETFAEGLRICAEIYHNLKKLLEEKGLSTGVGDEGGFAPDLPDAESVLDLLVEAIEASGYVPGQDIRIAMDAASSELYNEKTGMYHFPGESKLKGEEVLRDTGEMISYYERLVENYPIISIEDGLDENDWDGWQELTKRLGEKIQLVGDDLFVTNTKRLDAGIKLHCGNAILVKVNQIGTLSEAFEAVEMAHKNGYKAVISHRSGETEDTTIADIAVALNAGQIKTGAPCRSDRVAKYNRLLAMEEGVKGCRGIYGAVPQDLSGCATKCKLQKIKNV